MKYLLSALLILFTTAQLAVASPRHEFAERPHPHASAVSPSTQDVRANVNHSERLRQQQDGQALVPIANQDLRGLLFVLAGLAGPAAFLFATP
ncbi:MAG: hypothetical protein ACR652_22005 [Methylocystis sp.]|uniref:hypothetical protein n=1 Tax=Methylocystis sp. TaxID=1911079 RepID=UPI003DA32698